MNISHKVLPMPSIEAQEEVARQVVDGYVPGTLCSQCGNAGAVYVCSECGTHICSNCFNHCSSDDCCPVCGALTMY